MIELLVADVPPGTGVGSEGGEDPVLEGALGEG